MADFIYSAWFVDHAADPDDQDHEWVACIGIEAGTEQEAQEWGDVLSRDRTARFPSERFIRSSVELKRDACGITDWSSLPSTRAGQSITDPEIGW